MANESPTQSDMATGGDGSRWPRADDEAVEQGSFLLSPLRRWLRWPRTSIERGHFSFRASMVVHALAMILLALWSEPPQHHGKALDLSAAWRTDEPLGA